jgi:hypothetical protein
MNKKTILAALFTMLLFSLAINNQSIKIDFASCTSSYSVVSIQSPTDQTYNTRFLTLNVSFSYGGLRYALYYSLDGNYEGTIPWNITNPGEFHVVYSATGLLKLPELSDGTHQITVTLECSVDISNGNPPSAPFKPTTPNGTHYVATWSDTVYFTVDSNEPYLPSPTNLVDSIAPSIGGLSIENKTYLTSDVNLNFTVNEKAAQITYSLDGKDNVTITGNATLTRLPIGAHNVTVYAWDSAGNVGASQIINFNVAKAPSTKPPETQPSSQPLPAAIIATLAASAAVIVIIVYLKKHEQ